MLRVLTRECRARSKYGAKRPKAGAKESVISDLLLLRQGIIILIEPLFGRRKVKPHYVKYGSYAFEYL